MMFASSQPGRPRVGSRRLLKYGGAALAGMLGLGILQATPAYAAAPTLVVKNVRVTEVDTGTTTAVTRVVLSEPAKRRVRVQYTTVNRLAKAGVDYVAQSGSVVIPRGRRVARISLTVLGDRLDERNEAFGVRIFRPVGATIADRLGLVRIVDDDPLPRILVGDIAVDEGDSGATVARFPLRLSEVSGRVVRVSYAITAGTATDGTDFVVAEPTGVVEFPAGTTTRSVGLAVLGDLLDENDETVNLTLSAPVNATVPDSTAVATIRDDDDLSLSVGDVTVVEGATASFTVRLSRPASQAVSFSYATSNGSAVSPSDYTATSGSRTIPAGSTTTTISVPTVNDTAIEATENFSLSLSGAVNAAIKDGLGVATVTDNDGPSLKVGDVTVVEGGTALVPVTLSAAVTKDVTFRWAISSGTATTSDYVAASGTGTIKARSTSTTIAVTTRQDTLIEADEVFYVNISSPTNAGIADAQGAVTIDDNDGPVMTISDEIVDEGATAYFEVKLATPAVQPVSFDWSTANGSATTPADYTGTSGNDVVIPVGQTSVTLSVKTTGDTSDEVDETFFVNLTDIRNAQVGDGQGRAVIIDDDEELTIAGPTMKVTEGAAAVFTVSLVELSGKTVTVNYATVDGTAVSTPTDKDFNAASGTLTFAPGVKSQTVTVTTLTDNDNEGDEDFEVVLSGATNATLKVSEATATIADVA